MTIEDEPDRYRRETGPHALLPARRPKSIPEAERAVVDRVGRSEGCGGAGKRAGEVPTNPIIRIMFGPGIASAIAKMFANS